MNAVTHTVLMPFSRPKFFRTLREGMEGQGVTWVPLYDSDECDKLFADLGETASIRDGTGKVLRSGSMPDWIKPWRGDLPKEKYVDYSSPVTLDKSVEYPTKLRPTVNPGHWMCDAFLDEQVRRDEIHGESSPLRFFRKDHYVSFMTDDCYWSWNYWRKIQRHFVKRTRQGEEYAPAVIMTATTVPGNGGLGLVQPAYSPNWSQSNLRTFSTRFEALTVRADLLKEPRFGSFWAADGIMVERLVQENVGKLPENVVCVPDSDNAVVYFNALRPECYGFPAEHQR
jgi:hypothetical protein